MLYAQLETMITRGKYVKEDLMKKMDFYLLNDRITQAEYTELVALMGK